MECLHTQSNGSVFNAVVQPNVFPLVHSRQCTRSSHQAFSECSGRRSGQHYYESVLHQQLSASDDRQCRRRNPLVRCSYRISFALAFFLVVDDLLLKLKKKLCAPEARGWAKHPTGKTFRKDPRRDRARRVSLHHYDMTCIGLDI